MSFILYFCNRGKRAILIFFFFQLLKWNFKNIRTITIGAFNENRIKNIDVPNSADVVIIGEFMLKTKQRIILIRLNNLDKN